MRHRIRHTGGFVIGWFAVVAGLVMLVLPGPGTLVLAAGVAMLAPHYDWARRALEPLRRNAKEGAQRSVASPGRIALSAAGALWFLGVGLIWLVEPQIPVFDIWGMRIGPGLPGGRSAGVGLIGSGVAAGALLIYSVRRWYPGRTGPTDR